MPLYELSMDNIGALQRADFVSEGIRERADLQRLRPYREWPVLKWGLDWDRWKRPGLVLERTEGNPLFMEELVNALFDEGVLVRNGAVKVTKSLSQLKIPPTVQGILASRIDRLLPEAKELLQTLAVIGTEFPLSLVRRVVQLPDDRLDHMLSDLQLAEFIYEQPAAGDVEYRFKHALTRDVAYNSLLSERRRLLHERTAQAIKALYHERIEDHYGDLAHHYRLSANPAKAVEYLRLAGVQAAQRGAYEQALGNVGPALELLKALPERPERLRAELGVRLMQGNIVTPLYGLESDERLQTFQRVCELAEQLDDDSALLRGLLNIPGVYYGRGDIAGGRQMAERCVRFAEGSPNPGALINARFFSSAGCGTLGPSAAGSVNSRRIDEEHRIGASGSFGRISASKSLGTNSCKVCFGAACVGSVR